MSAPELSAKERSELLEELSGGKAKSSTKLRKRKKRAATQEVKVDLTEEERKAISSFNSGEAPVDPEEVARLMDQAAEDGLGAASPKLKTYEESLKDLFGAAGMSLPEPTEKELEDFFDALMPGAKPFAMSVDLGGTIFTFRQTSNFELENSQRALDMHISEQEKQGVSDYLVTNKMISLMACLRCCYQLVSISRKDKKSEFTPLNSDHRKVTVETAQELLNFYEERIYTGFPAATVALMIDAWRIWTGKINMIYSKANQPVF